MTIQEKRQVLIDECEKKYNHDCTCCPHNGDNDFWCHNTHSVEELDSVQLSENIRKVNQTTEDIVNHPSHYTKDGMECIDEMILVFGKQAVQYFCLCNAWKYRRRCLYKNGEEDMQKSHWYMQKYKELSEEGQYEAYC